jgi:hypothetical protein
MWRKIAKWWRGRKPKSDELNHDDVFLLRNVDVRMSRAQAKILRDKLRELQDSGAKTADGKPVNNRAQAVRWILENEVSV